MVKGLTMMRKQFVLTTFTLAGPAEFAATGGKTTHPLTDNVGGRTPADDPESGANLFQPIHSHCCCGQFRVRRGQP
jgi:hypothetical protein